MNLAIKKILKINVSLSFACTDKGSIEDILIQNQIQIKHFDKLSETIVYKIDFK